MAYGSSVLIEDLNFTIRRGDIFVIMGGSGCGKSTLMRQMIGLKRPARGQVLYGGVSFWDADPRGPRAADAPLRRAVPAGRALELDDAGRERRAAARRIHRPRARRRFARSPRSSWPSSGLAGFEDYYPSAISGGMRKRAGLARAMALDPEILFFDEPSAGLDPISSRRLDDLILELRDSLGATIVIVTHELASIFAIADNSVFLDPETKSQLATGDPHDLLARPPDPKVEEFLTRGGSERPGNSPSQSQDGRCWQGGEERDEQSQSDGDRGLRDRRARADRGRPAAVRPRALVRRAQHLHRLLPGLGEGACGSAPRSTFAA